VFRSLARIGGAEIHSYPPFLRLPVPATSQSVFVRSIGNRRHSDGRKAGTTNNAWERGGTEGNEENKGFRFVSFATFCSSPLSGLPERVARLGAGATSRVARQAGTLTIIIDNVCDKSICCKQLSCIACHAGF
jgi:hypothetical protein